jgi:7tm Odorant receptor
MNAKSNQLIAKVLRDTNYGSVDARFWKTIESYTNIEWKLLLLFYVITIGMASSLMYVNFVFQINETRLPYDFYIPFVSSYENLTNWLINYLFQFVVTFFAVSATLAYTAIMIIVMCHGCLKVDTVICTVESFDGSADQNEAKRWLENVAAESKDLLDYLEMANGLIAPSTLTDTLILCSSVCLAIFSFAEEFSFVCCTILFVALFQMYAYNFGGQQVRNKLDDLNFAVYDSHWYNLSFKQQKDVLFVMVSLQSFKGFNSFFFELSHATFYKVSSKLSNGVFIDSN